MTDDRALQLAFLALAMILPLSALIVRGIPSGQVIRLALIWIVIIVTAVLLVEVLRGRSASTEGPGTTASARIDDMQILHNIYYQDA